MSDKLKKGVRFVEADSDDEGGEDLFYDEQDIDLAGTNYSSVNLDFDVGKSSSSKGGSGSKRGSQRGGGSNSSVSGGNGKGSDKVVSGRKAGNSVTSPGTGGGSTSGGGAAAEEDDLSIRKLRPISMLPDRRKEGYLSKRGLIRQNWKKRWFVLTRDYLFYFKKPKDDQAIGQIALADIRVGLAESITRKDNSFQLFHADRRTFFLDAGEKQEQEEWMKAIQSSVDAISKLVSKPTTSSKELVNPDQKSHIVGMPIRQGYLEKKAQNKKSLWGRRWFVVTPSHLHQFTTFAEVEPTASWDLKAHMIETINTGESEIEGMGGEWVIVLRSPEHEPVYLSAPTEGERTHWFESLQSAIGVKNNSGSASASSTSNSAAAASKRKAGPSGRGSTGSRGSRRKKGGSNRSKGSKGSAKGKLNKPAAEVTLEKKRFDAEEVEATKPEPETDEDKVKIDVGSVKKKDLKGRKKPPFASTIPREHQGYLEKEGYVVRNWKKRFFVLSTNTLFYFKDAYDSEPTGTIPMAGCSVGRADDITKKARTIHIFHPTLRNYFLQAADEEKLTQWMSALRSAIKRANKNNTGIGAKDAALKETLGK